MVGIQYSEYWTTLILADITFGLNTGQLGFLGSRTKLMVGILDNFNLKRSLLVGILDNLNCWGSFMVGILDNFDFFGRFHFWLEYWTTIVV